jgi:hypothetical protein
MGHISRNKGLTRLNFLKIEFSEFDLTMELEKLQITNLELFLNSTDSTFGPIAPIIGSIQVPLVRVMTRPRYD